MKNYRAQTPQSLVLAKILQKFMKTSTPEIGNTCGNHTTFGICQNSVETRGCKFFFQKILP